MALIQRGIRESNGSPASKTGNSVNNKDVAEMEHVPTGGGLTFDLKWVGSARAQQRINKHTTRRNTTLSNTFTIRRKALRLESGPIKAEIT